MVLVLRTTANSALQLTGNLSINDKPVTTNLTAIRVQVLCALANTTTWANGTEYIVALSIPPTNCTYSFVSFIDNNSSWTPPGGGGHGTNPDTPAAGNSGAGPTVPDGSSPARRFAPDNQRPPNNKVDIAPPACVNAINPNYTVDSPVNSLHHPVFFWQGDNSSAYGTFCFGTYEEHRVTAVLEQVTDQSHQAGIVNVTDNGLVRSLGWAPNG